MKADAVDLGSNFKMYSLIKIAKFKSFFSTLLASILSRFRGFAVVI